MEGTERDETTRVLRDGGSRVKYTEALEEIYKDRDKVFMELVAGMKSID